MGKQVHEGHYWTIHWSSACPLPQYAFPPSSVGECGRVGATSRREVGHGTLAERSLVPILPSEAQFPYTVRVESMITESNGSSR